MESIMNTANLLDPKPRYELGLRLGGGIIGEVFEAIDKEANNKKVAAKIQLLSSESEKSIYDEYIILRDLCSSHTNLVDFYGIFCDRQDKIEKIWFIMEYCEGGPAVDLVRGLQTIDKKMTEEHIAFILRETIKALIFLHEQNVIHRNIRASNILLTREGDVKLADFGLSCCLSTNLGKRNTTIGSPSWMAPEVVAGGDVFYGNRADVWSLGITTIELADGIAPFQEMHPTRALFQIVRNPPPTLYRPSNWSNNLNDFISECLVKNPEHRPYSVELIEHPFILAVPENDYYLTQELKVLMNEFKEAGKKNKLPERLIRNGKIQTEINPEPEIMHVEDLAALENLSEDTILNEFEAKVKNGTFQMFIGDILVILNPNCDIDIYNTNIQNKYKFKSRSDNGPHIYAIADSAYQDAIHHDEPQYIIFSGESRSGKTTNMLHTMKHLTYLGQTTDATADRIKKSMDIILAAISAGTPINSNSTRCILQTQITYGKSGKLSGAIFWIYQLEKWRISTTDMTHANFNLVYYFYDAMEADGKLIEYQLEPDRKHRYLRVIESPKLICDREDPKGNVSKFHMLEQYLKDLEFENSELETLWRTLAAILILGNVRFNDGISGAAEIENIEESTKVASLLGLDESKFNWALINYCVVEKGTAEKRRHSTDEARDARDVLSATIYRRLVDWLINSINQKLSFCRSVYGDKYSISLLDMFGFECFHRNRLEQLFVNTMNEQMQFLYNQRVFAWEMHEQEEEQIPVVNLHFYDNKTAVDQLMSRPLGLFYILDEACRSSGGQEYIMSTIKNSSKGPYVKLAGSHEFSIAHYTGRINYDARDLTDKNRDFLPPEMIETLRGSNCNTIRQFFIDKLTKSGSLTAPSSIINTNTDKNDKEGEITKTRKYNTSSKGQYSQMHKMRTAASIFRATSLELLRTFAAAPGAAGVIFVRCIRPTLDNTPKGFQREVVRQQMRALAILDTVKAKQLGYSTRIPFSEFLRRYKFLAFDFDENVEISKDNCRLLLIRLKLEGWAIGKTKVFLKYYNVEYLSRLYESQVKKIIKVQSMMRAFLARRRIEKNKVKTLAVSFQSKSSNDISKNEAAIAIQKAFRGYIVRKAYGPLINKATGKIDEETADFLRHFTAKWRSKTIFQVLLQYRAARYQDLVNFSQQVHIFNQTVMQNLVATNSNVTLDKIDPQAKPLEFLGHFHISVWKLPFRINELPFFDTTFMCDSSVKCNDGKVGYDSDPETWDEPLRRHSHAASKHIRLSIQDTHNEQDMEITNTANSLNQSLIYLPFNRDPSQEIKKIPSDDEQQIQPTFSPKPVERQNYGNNQQVWKDNETGRVAVYKKKHPSQPGKSPKTSHIDISNQEKEDWDFPRLSLPKKDLNKNIYGGSMPSDINNPIEELQKLGRTKSIEFSNEDDPPFNFQAMLRKTPKNRASMKRNGETLNEVPIDANANIEKPESKIKPEITSKLPTRPRSSQDFKRKDSVELFKMALKRTDSTPMTKGYITNGNLQETVILAPGISVEGLNPKILLIPPMMQTHNQSRKSRRYRIISDSDE